MVAFLRHSPKTNKRGTPNFSKIFSNPTLELGAFISYVASILTVLLLDHALQVVVHFLGNSGCTKMSYEWFLVCQEIQELYRKWRLILWILCFFWGATWFWDTPILQRSLSGWCRIGALGPKKTHQAIGIPSNFHQVALTKTLETIGFPPMYPTQLNLPNSPTASHQVSAPIIMASLKEAAPTGKIMNSYNAEVKMMGLEEDPASFGPR